MTTTLQTQSTTQVKNNTPTIDGKELIAALSTSQLLPQVIKEIIIEKAIAQIPYTQAELKSFLQKLCLIYVPAIFYSLLGKVDCVMIRGRVWGRTVTVTV